MNKHISKNYHKFVASFDKDTTFVLKLQCIEIAIFCFL